MTTDESIYVCTMHMVPVSGYTIPDHDGALSPIVVSFDYLPTRDDIKRAFLSINGFNSDIVHATVTVAVHGYDRDRFQEQTDRHAKSGKAGFMATGAQFGPWVFRVMRIPLHKQVSLDGVRAP